MQTKKFQKRIEDFTCENCGVFVKGDGYTNHCPKCLWSKHVDVNPGDRASACGGLMKPVGTEGTVAKYFVLHKCVRCRKISRNIFGKGDNMEALLSIVKTIAGEKGFKR